jgi:DNA mismatch repair protein MutS2
VLEWPAVSRQVGCFCGTSMAAEALLAGRLPIGRSRSESNLLLQQTQEALVAQLDVAGVCAVCGVCSVCRIGAAQTQCHTPVRRRALNASGTCNTHRCV